MNDGSTGVRRASVEDIDALVPLFDAYRQFYEQPSNPGSCRGFLAERFRQNESTVFIAEDTSRAAVGFAQLFPTFSSVSLARTFVLNDLFVVPRCRRSGTARALLSSAVDFCRSAGAVRISLSTATSNGPAQALYERSGWARQTEYFVYTLKLG